MTDVPASAVVLRLLLTPAVATVAVGKLLQRTWDPPCQSRGSIVGRITLI